MSGNENGVLFQAKRANAYAMLKSMSRQGLISQKEHYALWLGLLKAKDHDDLDKATAEIFKVYKREGGQLNDSVAS